VELLRDLLARENLPDWRKPAESLRRFLVDPIERAGWLDKITKLYIVPHGTLHYLPFGLLPREGVHRYLIEDYVLAYLPAAAALLRRRGPGAEGTLFAVAPARTKLAYAQEEAGSISEFFPSEKRVLVGASATESSFKRDAGRYQILHLATHGYFNKLNPLFSALELEADQSDDGRLEVHEILNLRLKANLVALSACETALGSGYFAEAPAGDDFVGLTRAFLYAGSPAVLATLWEVNDRSALDLMRSFYRALPQWGNAQALAEAQRAVVRQGGRYAHPYFWAPFVLVGEMK
jgi:CHAT domain-containing protein